MITVPQVSDQIVRFLAGEQSLNDLNGWLAKYTWDVTQQQPNSNVQSLVGNGELALAEYSNRHLSLAELRKRLSEMVPNRQLPAHPRA